MKAQYQEDYTRIQKVVEGRLIKHTEDYRTLATSTLPHKSRPNDLDKNQLSQLFIQAQITVRAIEK